MFKQFYYHAMPNMRRLNIQISQVSSGIPVTNFWVESGSRINLDNIQTPCLLIGLGIGNKNNTRYLILAPYFSFSF